MAVLHREGQWHHKQYIYSPACFHILPPQDASNPSVSGAGLKIGSGPGTEPETVTFFFTGTTTLFLLPFSGCSCRKGARLSGPSSQLRASQSLFFFFFFQSVTLDCPSDLASRDWKRGLPGSLDQEPSPALHYVRIPSFPWVVMSVGHGPFPPVICIGLQRRATTGLLGDAGGFGE